MKNRKRIIKNTVMISIIVVLLGGTYFTMYKANKSIQNNVNTQFKNGSFQNSNTNQQPIMDGNEPPQLNENEAPPDMENGEQIDVPSTNGETQNTPPEKPEDNNNTQNTKEGMKEKNHTRKNSETNNVETQNNEVENNNQNQNSNFKQRDNMNGMMEKRQKVINTTQINHISFVYYIIFGIESLIISILTMYLIMSCFNKKSFKETFKNPDKIVIFILSTSILTSALTYTENYISKNIMKNSSQETSTSEANSNIEYSSKTTIEKEETLKSKTIETDEIDESVVLVKNKGNLTITDSTINKTGGDSSNTENSEFYGVNAAFLVTANSTATIKNTKITASAKGSNAVFSTGENSKIYISDSTIETTAKSSARGLDATYGGYIEADKVNIKTQGDSCATLATDRGEGTVIVKNSTLETNGSGSPLIYSTGDIKVTKTTGTSNNSQIVVIEGKNTATINNSTLEASGKGNRNDVDHAGVMIYQSMSGDAGEGTGTFTAKNSTLSIQKNSEYYKTAPMFFITNTSAVINLESTKLNYGSNTLISAKQTSEWGKEGENGADVTFNATKEELVGNIEVDNLSSLKLNLTNSSYKGGINTENKAKNITLKLDKDSTITLTANSYVTSLEDADSSYSNINFNGYKLYVNGKSIN